MDPAIRPALKSQICMSIFSYNQGDDSLKGRNHFYPSFFDGFRTSIGELARNFAAIRSFTTDATSQIDMHRLIIVNRIHSNSCHDN